MNKGFRFILSLVLVVVMVCGMAGAESILPDIPKPQITELPSVGEALGRYPDSETQQEDGSVTEFYSGISEEDYQVFGIYLGEQGATLGTYELEGVVLTAEIQAEGTSFQLVYDSGAGEIWVTYPAGTRAKKAEISVQVRGTVKFGRYPQTAEGTDETPIEWIVLEADEENHRALLLSKYGLDAKLYNTARMYVTWETCDLRTWLNNDFLNGAFTAEEKSTILLTDIDNSSSQGYSGYSSSGGNNTQDLIFLLSYAEAKRYFSVAHNSVSGSGRNTVARVAPTAYAIKQGALTSVGKTADGSAAGWWWLRSPGHYQGSAALVFHDGSVHDNIINSEPGCVRPAMWVSLDAISSAP